MLYFILLGERPFKCHICQKAFKQSSDLKKHINLHTGANQFKCEECNMEFRRADALRKHKLGHKVGNMPCGHCGKNFLHIGALRAHRAMHNGETYYIYLTSLCQSIQGQGFKSRGVANIACSFDKEISPSEKDLTSSH